MICLCGGGGITLDALSSLKTNHEVAWSRVEILKIVKDSYELNIPMSNFSGRLVCFQETNRLEFQDAWRRQEGGH